MLIISNRAIYITKGKKRNSVCRYSGFHVTHATISILLIITLYRIGTVQEKDITYSMMSIGALPDVTYYKITKSGKK